MLIFSFLFTISTTAFGTGSAFPISTQPTPANGTSLRARDGTSGWRKTGDVGPKHLMSRGPRGHHQTSGGWSKRTNDDRIAKDAAMVAILDDFYGRSAVITEVSIGQPPQKIKMLVDTGSGVLLTSMRQIFLTSVSHAWKAIRNVPSFKAQFEDSSVLCMLGSDTMQLLGLHTDDFPFGMVASVGGDAYWAASIPELPAPLIL
ncbi:hypothetical protein FRB99_007886 [Tulasnella sp. 403]|nr:hypothetical protein FRB99_007886 [Tulasnella sp. 403]